MVEQALFVSLEARVTKYERDLQKARAATNDNFKQMERRAGESSRRMQKSVEDASGGISKSLTDAFGLFTKASGGVLAIGAGIAAVKQVASSIAEVSREAAKAGVTADTWQRWQYVAVAAGASVDGMTDALKELNIRGDEFARTGKGSAQEAFTRLGMSATDVAAKLQDPSRFLDEIIGKLQGMDAAAQTRNLDELFGGTGAEELAKVLGMSVSEIQKMRSEAATFSTDQIKAAKKIDAEFETLWRNFTVYAKSAAIDTVGVLGTIKDFLNPGQDQYDAAIARHNSPEGRLEKALGRRKRIADELAAIESNPVDWIGKSVEIDQLKASLAAVDDEIIAVGGGSDQLKNGLAQLSQMTSGVSQAFDRSKLAAANFKSSLNDLKALVPSLKDELQSLSEVDKIDAAYLAAAKSARTMSELNAATTLAEKAKSDIRVKDATSNPSGFLQERLAAGKNRSHIEGMSGEFQKKLTNMIANLPKELEGSITINSGYRSEQRQAELWADALKKYGSAEAARKWVAPPGKSQHGRGNAADLGYANDSARKWAHENAGSYGLSFPLGNENWHIEDEEARGKQQAADTEKQIETINRLNQARQSVNRTAQEALDLAEFERSLQGQTDAQKQTELQLFQYQQTLKREGITLTQDEIAKLREQISMTGQLDRANQKSAASAEAVKEANRFFAENMTSSLSGLLTGTQTLNGALQNLANSLLDAVLQATLLGQGPLGGILGGATGSGLLGKVMGFSEGGWTGPGSKYQAAGVVHADEFVFSKRATRAIGVGNLDAMHKGALRGYASGGFVGNAPALQKPSLTSSGEGATAAPQISISSPITINGSSGTPEQNDDLAKKMSREMESTMRSTVASEIMKQMKQGNMLNRRS